MSDVDVLADAAESTVVRPSVLFAGDQPDAGRRVDAQVLRDLNLDQVVAAVTAGSQSDLLRRLFTTRVADERILQDRQEVVRDVQRGTTHADLAAFCAGMGRYGSFRTHAGKIRHGLRRARWLLDAARLYQSVVRRLDADLTAAAPRSAGLSALARYTAQLVASPAFQRLDDEIEQVRTALVAIRYGLLVKDNRITVQPEPGLADYGERVRETFARFRQTDRVDDRTEKSAGESMNHVEEAILDRVAEVYPEPFTRLIAFAAAHGDVADPVVVTFDREIRFFLSYLDFCAPLEAAGLPFCLPEVTHHKDILASETFDLALAAKLIRSHGAPVTNDIELSGPERVLVVTGPNNGGKTTYARTFGQLHHLAALGLPVPGRAARLLLADNVFTHFERVEAPDALRGKLADELVRAKDILAELTADSVVVLNETFASTTVADAQALGSELIRRIIASDAAAVYVTFLDELTRLGDGVVSVVATVPDDDPTARTHRLVRRPAEGTAHAMALARRYRLTYRQLLERTGEAVPA